MVTATVLSLLLASAGPLAGAEPGTVWGWGNNELGQLGDGSTEDRLTPVEMSRISGAVMASAGDSYSHVLKADGTAWGTGSNMYGNLGDGTTINRVEPVTVLSGVRPITNLISVAADKGIHALALKADGSVWAWGDNTMGGVGRWDDDESADGGAGGGSVERRPGVCRISLLRGPQGRRQRLDVGIQRLGPTRGRDI